MRRGRAAVESARAGRPEGGMGWGGGRWGAQLALSAAGALLLLLVDVYFRTAALSFPDRPTPEMGGGAVGPSGSQEEGA